MSVSSRVVPLRVPPERNESLQGYLARVAEINRYDRTHWLVMQCQGTSYSQVNVVHQLDTRFWTDETIARISEYLGQDVREISSRVYKEDGSGNVTFFGHSIASTLIERGDATVQKFCPACLAKTGIQSALFDLRVMQVCVKHTLYLRTSCSQCGRRTSWNRGLVTRCRCGLLLAHAPTESVPAKSLIGLSAIAKAAGFSEMCPKGMSSNIARIPDLAHLGLGELIELLVFLAHCEKRQIQTFDALHSTLHEDLNRAWQIARSWPEGFYEFLAETDLTGSESNKRTYGLQKIFLC